MRAEGFDFQSRRVARGAAMVIAAIAVLALAGWMFDRPGLTQLGASYLPMRLNTAVGLSGVALAFLGMSRNVRSLTLLGASLAVIMGTATLAQYLGRVDLGVDALLVDAGRVAEPARMSAASAVLLLLAGLAQVGLATPRWWDSGGVLAGTLGCICALMTLVVLLSYSTDALGMLRTSLITGLPVMSAVAYAVIGLTLMTLSWRRDSVIPVLPEWVPVAAGGAALITTLFVWRGLTLEQHERNFALLRSEALIGRQQVAAQLDHNLTLLCQLDGISSAGNVAWKDAASMALVQSPAVEAVVHAAAPATEIVARSTASAAQLQWARVGSGRPAGVQLIGNGAATAMLISAPACSGASAADYTVALVSPTALLQASLAGALPGYQVGISIGDRMIYNALDAEGLSGTEHSSITFDAHGARWTVDVWPGVGAAPLFHGELPPIVATLGIVVALLLAAGLRFVRLAGLATHRETLEHAAASLRAVRAASRNDDAAFVPARS